MLFVYSTLSMNTFACLHVTTNLFIALSLLISKKVEGFQQNKDLATIVLRKQPQAGLNKIKYGLP